MEYTSPGNMSIAQLLSALLTMIYLSLPITANSNSYSSQGHRQHQLRSHRDFIIHQARARTNAHSYRDFSDYEYDEAPVFLDTETNLTAMEGRTAILPCSVRYLGTKQVAWTTIIDGNSSFLTVGTYVWVREKRIKVEYKAEENQMLTEWNLVIKSVEKTDAGVYQCQITDKVILRRTVYLSVKPRPPPRPAAVTISGKEFVDKGEKIHLTCNATGGPRVPVALDWFKDGTKVDTSSMRGVSFKILDFIVVENQALVSELIIRHAVESDSGLYICRSSDKEIASLKVTVLIGQFDHQRLARDPKAKGYVVGDYASNPGAETTNKKRDSEDRAVEADKGMSKARPPENSSSRQHTPMLMVIAVFCVSLLLYPAEQALSS